jgi:hypothetical protein
MNDEVGAIFNLQPLDRWLFQTEIGESAGHWEVTKEGLRALLPAGTTDRPPLKIIAQLHLKGDFELLAQYAITSLPHPTTSLGSNNVEVALSGPNGFATCFRNNEAGAREDGYGFYVDYADQRNTVFRHFPTKATAGILAVRRTGKKLTFLQGGVGSSLGELGSLDFGDAPITGVALQALANSTTDGLDVRFERVEIRADRIVRLHEPSRLGLNWWFWGPVGTAVTLIAAWAVRRWKTA